MSRPGSGQIIRTIRPRSGDNSSFNGAQNNSLEALLPDPPAAITPRNFLHSEPRASPLSIKRRSSDESSTSKRDNSNLGPSPANVDIVDTADAMEEALENARALREAQTAEWAGSPTSHPQLQQSNTMEALEDFSIPFDFLVENNTNSPPTKSQHQNANIPEKRSNQNRKGKRIKSAKNELKQNNNLNPDPNHQKLVFQNKMQLIGNQASKNEEFKQDDDEDDKEYKRGDSPISRSDGLATRGGVDDDGFDRSAKVNELEEYLQRLNQLTEQTSGDAGAVHSSSVYELNEVLGDNSNSSLAQQYGSMALQSELKEEEEEDKHEQLFGQHYHGNIPSENRYDNESGGDDDDGQYRGYEESEEDYALKELHRRRLEFTVNTSNNKVAISSSSSTAAQPPTSLKFINLWDEHAKEKGFNTKGAYERYQGMLAEESGVEAGAGAEEIEHIAKGLERIRHLDLLLAAKERESSQLRNQQLDNRDLRFQQNIKTSKEQRQLIGLDNDARPDTADSELSSHPGGDRAFLTEGFLQRKQYQKKNRSYNRDDNDDGSSEYGAKSTGRSKISHGSRSGVRVDRIAENISNAKNTKKCKPISMLSQEEHLRVAELMGDDNEEREENELTISNQTPQCLQEAFGDKYGTVKEQMNYIDDQLQKLGSKTTPLHHHFDPLDVMSKWGADGGNDPFDEDDDDDDEKEEKNNQGNEEGNSHLKEDMKRKKKNKINELEIQRRKRKVNNRLKELDERLNGLKEAWVEVTEFADPNQRGLQQIKQEEVVGNNREKRSNHHHVGKTNNNDDGDDDDIENGDVSSDLRHRRSGRGGLLGEVRRIKFEKEKREIAQNNPNLSSLSPEKSSSHNNYDHNSKQKLNDADKVKQKVYKVSKAEILMVLAETKRLLLHSSSSSSEGVEKAKDEKQIQTNMFGIELEDKAKIKDIIKSVSHEVEMLSQQRNLRQFLIDEQNHKTSEEQEVEPHKQIEEANRIEEQKKKERRRKRAERKAAYEKQIKLQKETLPPAVSSLFRSPLIPEDGPP